MEAQEHRSGWPIPSPADLPNPGLEPRSPALQVDSLPIELCGKHLGKIMQLLSLLKINCMFWWCH